jgi:acetyl esterase/lipase
MPPTPFPVRRINDVVYACPDGNPLLADLYLPQNVLGLLPVIVWIHGGGWRLGDRRLTPDLSRFFAERRYAMVSIDYRLSDTAIFPAAVHDVKTAIRWLHSAADTYSLDPEKIGLWGASAGGHLAALAALSALGMFEEGATFYSEFPSTGVRAVVNGYGPTDFLQLDSHRDPEGKPSDDPESIQLPPGKLASDADSYESRFLGSPIQTCPEIVRQANPITHVHPDAPPFLILHGMSDTAVPYHQSALLYEALAAQNNEVTLLLVEGLGHGFLNRNHFDQGAARPVQMRRKNKNQLESAGEGPPVTFSLIESFFDRHLKSADK